MKNRALLAVIAVLIGVAVLADFASHGAIARALKSALGTHGPLRVGQAYPAMDFEALDGTEVRVAPTAGRVTFYNVFATWCAPCKAETPELVAFASSPAARDVDVVGLDREESPAAVTAFRARYGISYATVIDTGRATREILGARIMPTTYVVDGTGVLRDVVVGPMTRDEMTRLAATAAAGQ